MASLTVTVPNAMVPRLVAVATVYLNGIGVDTSNMTQVQIGQRYVVEKLRADYVSQAVAEAQAAATASVLSGRDQAATDAAGIV